MLFAIALIGGTYAGVIALLVAMSTLPVLGFALTAAVCLSILWVAYR